MICVLIIGVDTVGIWGMDSHDLYILSILNENSYLRHCLQYYLILELHFLI